MISFLVANKYVVGPIVKPFYGLSPGHRRPRAIGDPPTSMDTFKILLTIPSKVRAKAEFNPVLAIEYININTEWAQSNRSAT